MHGWNNQSAAFGDSLAAGFFKSSQRFPDRPALEVEGQALTYSQLLARVSSLAATLVEHSPNNDPRLTAVFACRSVTAFVGILGALFRGHGYVPLNRTFPPARTRTMLERSGCHAVVVDELSALQLDEVLQGITRPLTLIFPEKTDVSAIAKRHPQHLVIGRKLLASSANIPPAAVDPNAVGYLLFTSGSTGVPKGVMVAHRNVRHYVNWTVKRYHLVETDRCSQTFDMTFDLSAHDLFVTWEQGACLCCPTQKQMINPAGFIKESKLTTWFSVPSAGMFMRRLRMLEPGMYPGLRLSLFCGEALPVEIAKAWASAAPNSVLENIYGPTELTIACAAYRWDPGQSPGESEFGLVPIGEPFDRMSALVLDENLREVPVGSSGELVMAGPQVALGYWRDPEKTAAAFVVPPYQTATFYRTGDRVRRAAPGKPLVYLGRIDNQIKILGHRAELGEIEAVLREECGLDGVVAVGWPMEAAGAGGVEAFAQTSHLDDKPVIERMRARLPSYMVPRHIYAVPQFPLNSSGKIDRKALAATLGEKA